jgi:hypothetical protein
MLSPTPCSIDFWPVHQHAVEIPKWPVIGITGMFVAVFGLTTP